MSVVRNALVDLSQASSTDADVYEYLVPTAEAVPAAIASKPNSLDDFDDVTIDTAKWDVTGTITETTFLGVDGLSMTDPTSPAWDSCGVIYKPAILATAGSMVFARCIMEHPVEFVFSLQEYEFTVDSVGSPTTWTLKYDVVQATKNSMGLRAAPGALYFFAGGASGTQEYVSALPTKMSATGAICPLQVAFVATATGWDIWAHVPGIWAAPSLVKSYTRPVVHAPDGYSLCVDKYTSDSTLHFYNPAFNFKSNVQITGGRLIVANTTDYVQIGSMQVTTDVGYNAEQQGSVNVQIPDHSAAWLTLTELAAVTDKLTGAQVYPINFELNGDAAVKHPVRMTVEDATLTETPSAEAS